MAFSVNKQSNKSIDKLFGNKSVNLQDNRPHDNQHQDNTSDITQIPKDILFDPNNNMTNTDDTFNLHHQEEDTNIIYDNEPFYHNEKNYFFLNDHILSQTFGDFMNTDKQYNIKICIYKINGECDIPFLQFLFDKSGEKVTFPNIDFHCPTTNATSNTDQFQESSNPEHIFFMNQCSQELLKVLPIHDIFSEDILKQIYKGFIEYDNTLYIVFDSTKIEDPIIDQSKYSWSIIDEVINSRKILDKEFDPEIVDMFIKTPYMMHILDDKGQRIVYPFLLYICIKLTPEATIYNNALEPNNINSINIIDEQIDHPLLGSYYYFSPTPLEGADLTRIKRYAVFTFDGKYILTDINNIKEKDEFIMNLDDDDSNLSIYFKEDGIQLWCIKTSEQFTDI